MARRKKGNPVNGWLVLDKPSGVTSTAMVGKARWALNAQKAGHAGTLDPLATGVLAIALGEATKTVPYVMDAAKTYRFTVQWGAQTSTDDTEGGEVIAQSDKRPARDDIEALLPRYTGDILQTPPKYSAIKVEGARAYDIMRDGDDVEIEARPVRVDTLSLVDCPDADTAVFEMTCGKGGYVRAIARDLGIDLGCLGHVTALRRVSSGPFSAEEGLTVEAVEAMRGDEDAPARLLPVSAGLSGLRRIDITPALAAQLRQGRAVPVPSGGYGETVWAALAAEAVAVGVVRGGQLHPNRIFLGSSADT